MNKLLTAACALICILSVNAEDVVIKSPEYLKGPIREGKSVFPDSLVFDRDAREIVIPEIGMIGRLTEAGFKNLKKVTFEGDIDYVPGGLFNNDSTIEEIEFNGLVGRFDCSLALHCPNLRRVVFHGPVSSTGGPCFAYDCSNLESVEFEGPVIEFGLGYFPDQLTPKLSGYTTKEALLNVYDENLTPSLKDYEGIEKTSVADGLKRLAQWQIEVLKTSTAGFMRRSAYEDAKVLLPVMERIDKSVAKELHEAMVLAWNETDDVKDMLEILKASPSYASDTVVKPEFRYSPPSDSLLTLSRSYFNLDSIAGNGTDVDRIKNLLYWVHDNIRHDGGNGLAPGARNLINTYESAPEAGCGYNCRALAICLTEALLAEGIPARYVTCESKHWDSDGDCHVICVAWSESLGKWIWVDPTFSAFVTDENGTLLHPGEVRYRLQHDMPLVLNEDANWNHSSETTKDYYLDYYMAKNLYIMSVNSLNQSEPEGAAEHPQGKFVALVPLESNYTNAHVITTDEDWFWQSPE